MYVDLSIDWEMLRAQKADLLDVIDLHQSETDASAKRQTDSLTGILHLIDGIQDFAVAKGGITSEVVFGPDELEEGDDT